MDTSFAAEIVGSNHDLLLQILMRLPVKSLMCFKSVSNDWHLIITDEVCARRDYVVSPTPDPSLGIFMRVKVGKFEDYVSVDDYRYEYIPFNPNHRFSNKSPVLRDFFTRPCPFRGDMILSSNGLLLFYDFDSHRYIVYNPTTLSYTIIPNPITEKTDDRWNSTVGVTMAFDLVTSHYKLIFVSPIRPILYTHQRCKIDIYSSETQAWNDSCIIKEVDCDMPGMLKNGVYWNGSVHWIVTVNYGASGKLLVFNIDTLALHEVIEPTMFTRYKYEHTTYFGESRGHLYHIEKEMNDLAMIYEMKTDYSKWLPKYRINFTKYYKGCHSSYLNVLSLIRFDYEKESEVLILWVHNKVVECNLTTRKFKTLREFPNDYSSGQSYVQKYVAEKEGKEKRVAVSPCFYTEGAFPFIPSLSRT